MVLQKLPKVFDNEIRRANLKVSARRLLIRIMSTILCVRSSSLLSPVSSVIDGLVVIGGQEACEYEPFGPSAKEFHCRKVAVFYFLELLAELDRRQCMLSAYET